MAIENVPDFLGEHYEIHERRHAIAILQSDFPAEWNDIVEVLTGFRLLRSAIQTPGGRKSDIADSIDRALEERGWREKGFSTHVIIDGEQRENPTHKIDSFKNRVGIEVEWNNKDPFYDRDLNNFRILFELEALDVGIIITRCDELQQIFDSLGKGKSYGASTTHMSKLLPRLEGGGAGGCPILVFGISANLYMED